MQLSLEKCSVILPVQNSSAQIEVFQDSDFIMTLKRYLSTKHSINAILDLLESSFDNEASMKCLRLLASIIIQNKNSDGRKDQSELLEIFTQIDGFSRLKALLAQKLPQMPHT